MARSRWKRASDERDPRQKDPSIVQGTVDDASSAVTGSKAV